MDKILPNRDGSPSDPLVFLMDGLPALLQEPSDITCGVKIENFDIKDQRSSFGVKYLAELYPNPREDP